MFGTKSAKRYASSVLGITSSKITYCRPTGRGFSNRSFCVIVGDRAYHVRLARNIFDLDRKMERAICERVGMTFLDFDEKNGNYVRDWIKGDTVRSWDEKRLRAVAQAMRAMHERTPLAGLKNLDPFLYSKQAKLPKKYAALYDELVVFYADRKHFWCHNDIHGSNVVEQADGKITLIDYEWSCLNNPLWEIGNFVREEGLSPVQVGVLVNEYGASIVTKELYDHVFLAAAYGYLWARAMPWNAKIAKQRLKTTKDLKKAYAATQVAF